MEFNFSDIDNLTEEELLERLDHNQNTAAFKRSELEKLKGIKNKKKIVIETPPKTFSVPKEVLKEEVIKDDLDDETDEFEDAVEYYLEDLRELDIDSIDDLEDELPPREHYDYKKIILRLLIEYKKEINDINEVMKEDKDLSKDELLELKEDVNKNNKMIKLLKESLKPVKEEQKEQKQKNNIIFSKTTGGNVRVIEELESIPSEYYPAFQELFESIEDGTFKGIKRFNNNRDLKGALEVRGFKVRVVFTKLSKKDYAVITAFVKKVDIDKGYLTPLKSKIADYRQEEKYIKENLEDPSFKEENEEYREKLFSLLDNKKKKEKSL